MLLQRLCCLCFFVNKLSLFVLKNLVFINMDMDTKQHIKHTARKNTLRCKIKGILVYLFSLKNKNMTTNMI